MPVKHATPPLDVPPPAPGPGGPPGRHAAPRRPWHRVRSTLLVALLAAASCLAGLVVEDGGRASESGTPLTTGAAGAPTGTSATSGSTATSSATAGAGSDGSTAGPPGSAQTWTKVFGDEFDGTSIDRSTWRVNRYGGTSQDGAFNPDIEGAYYSPDNVSVVDGCAVLTIHTDPATVGGHSYTHSSGIISSQDSFQLQDGDYVETRVWIPTGDGLWPAFWTLPADRWPPEIDVFEFFDTSKRDLPQFIYHAPDGVDVPQPADGNGYGDPATDYRESWHTYGMLRSGGRLVPYVDGVAHPENGVAYNVDRLPQFLVMNLAMYSYGDAVDGTSMRIDWVRVWRRV